MTDSIYYGNILGLLKTGKWSLSLAEAEAVVALAQETRKRLEPPKAEAKEAPLPTVGVKQAKVKNGNK